jgi:predicted HAD superfamily phosphohydrolase YqeG
MIGDALVADIHGAKKVNIDKCILVKDLNIYDKKTRR